MPCTSPTLPDGHFELQVHIADVAHYVPRGSALDREARLRGTSVYFPNRAVPMLPEELSNGICSLNPRLDRLVMSAIMEIDAAGNPVRAEFTPGVIRSAERMTYTNVNKVLEGDPEMNQRYAPLVDEFRRMKELALLLNRRRVARGSIDFDLPEPVIEFDPDGNMRSIIRSERNIAHRLIEEFMLAANEAVAEYLDRRAIAALYRVHEKPDPKKVLEFEELAQAFGYSLGVTDLAERRVAVRHGQAKPQARGHQGARPAAHERHAPGIGRSRHPPAALPAAHRKNRRQAGRAHSLLPDAALAQAGALRRRAARPFRPGGHRLHPFHFADSPLSGLDRAPRAQVGARKSGGSASARMASRPGDAQAGRRQRDEERVATLGPYRRVELEEISSESSEAERRAEAAERELMDWKTAQFMESHLGEEYDALIISVQKFGFFVELTEIFVEGLVSIDRLEEADRPALHLSRPRSRHRHRAASRRPRR